jgi:hypothetical protein
VVDCVAEMERFAQVSLLVFALSFVLILPGTIFNDISGNGVASTELMSSKPNLGVARLN